METQILSNQAISMATRDGDVIFSAFCNLVVLGLFAAEEKRLVSSSEVSPLDFEHVHIFGKRYKTMLKDMVEVVGDYGQIYEKYIESLVPRSKSQPRVKTIDFGNTKTDQLSQMTSIKIQEIKERGHLNCGFSNKFRFRAEKEQFNRTGVEVDFCKSISAAIFGPMGNVTYEPLHDFNSFNALKTGRIDVLARATTSTTEQDLMERATTQVGFSFSYPIFYDKTFYAGEPE